jgi:hypothetical protein
MALLPHVHKALPVSTLAAASSFASHWISNLYSPAAKKKVLYFALEYMELKKQIKFPYLHLA